MKWSIKEDEIVRKFYINHLDDWRSNIDVVMNELKHSWFVNRDVNSTMMCISNYAYLYTGVGLSNASKQTQSIYKNVINQVS